MITCTLRDKKYTIDYVSGRALRELEPAAQMYGKLVRVSDSVTHGKAPAEGDNVTVADAMDTMIHWFCLLFGNQFTVDDVLDGYPVDRLMHDIAFALMAVQTQATDVLSEFPTKAAQTNKKTV